MTKRTAPPDFIVIGAMRAGTTTLADRLSRHPDIGMSRLKETDYFILEKNFSRGASWYRSLFPEDKSILGEASPNYTKSDVFNGVPQRIYNARPDAKLIYIVRDPVDRFWSHYRHTFLMRGGVPDPDALMDEAEGRHILASSMYHRQLDAYYAVFPENQIFILDFCDLTHDETATIARICKFVGANDASLPSGKAVNSAEALANTPGWALKLSQNKTLTGLRAATPPTVKGAARRLLTSLQKAPRQTPHVSPVARDRVAAALAEDVARFRSRTGRAFSHWSV